MVLMGRDIWGVLNTLLRTFTNGKRCFFMLLRRSTELPRNCATAQSLPTNASGITHISHLHRLTCPMADEGIKMLDSRDFLGGTSIASSDWLLAVSEIYRKFQSPSQTPGASDFTRKLIHQLTS